MRFKKQSNSERVLPLEIAPMIDVVFLLIIFFMTTAQFARITRAELDLPQEPGEQRPAEEAGVVINVMRDGTLIVNERTVSLPELIVMVEDEMARVGGPAGLKLILRADREAPAARMNEVITRLQQLGIYTARVATEIPGGGP